MQALLGIYFPFIHLLQRFPKLARKCIQEVLCIHFIVVSVFDLYVDFYCSSVFVNYII